MKNMESIALEVLLIGNRSNDATPLSNYLKKRGCNCRYAVSKGEIWRLLDRNSFDLVLGPIRLTGEGLYPLLSRLDGSSTTLFYFHPVEDSCVWLPALRLGANCFGASALRPNEFAIVLNETIEKIRCTLRAGAEVGAVIGSGVPVLRSAPRFSRAFSHPAMPLSVGSPSRSTGKALG